MPNQASGESGCGPAGLVSPAFCGGDDFCVVELLLSLGATPDAVASLPGADGLPSLSALFHAS